MKLFLFFFLFLLFFLLCAPDLFLIFSSTFTVGKEAKMSADFDFVSEDKNIRVYECRHHQSTRGGPHSAIAVDMDKG